MVVGVLLVVGVVVWILRLRSGLVFLSVWWVAMMSCRVVSGVLVGYVWGGLIVG